MEPWFNVEERNAMNDYLQQGGWCTEFKKTQELEETICDYTGAKHCILVNNGTVSLTLAAIACEIKAGEEIIVPNYTMIATPNAVKMIGAKPIFIDVERETLCMDFNKLEMAITPKTKAIMFVNANGRYPKTDIKNYINLARENNVILIEDSAQSLGSYYPDGIHMGRKGVIGSFSFSTPKVISTGQGGALITDSDQMAQKIRRLKDFGRTSGGNDIHDTIGWNFKFTDIQAVIGIEQMKKLQWRVERKKEILKLYKKFLKKIKQIEFFNQDIKNTTPWFIDVLAENRDKLQKYLKDNDIGSRVMYPPITKQKAYQIKGKFPVAELVGQKGLWLPSASQLTNTQVKYICDMILDFYNK